MRVAPRDTPHHAQRAVPVSATRVIPSSLINERGISDTLEARFLAALGMTRAREGMPRSFHTARRTGRDAGCLAERGLSRRATSEAGSAGRERR